MKIKSAEEYDKIMDSGDQDIGFTSWKSTTEDVLELMDPLLEPYGLEIVKYDTGSTEVMWKVEKIK